MEGVPEVFDTMLTCCSPKSRLWNLKYESRKREDGRMSTVSTVPHGSCHGEVGRDAEHVDQDALQGPRLLRAVQGQLADRADDVEHVLRCDTDCDPKPYTLHPNPKP